MDIYLSYLDNFHTSEENSFMLSAAAEPHTNNWPISWPQCGWVEYSTVCSYPLSIIFYINGAWNVFKISEYIATIHCVVILPPHVLVNESFIPAANLSSGIWLTAVNGPRWPSVSTLHMDTWLVACLLSLTPPMTYKPVGTAILSTEALTPYTKFQRCQWGSV